ncbi:MAG: hypothetical protein F6K41_14270 [Symploca sp. SIO3E6]|nr:hypothetical protein [Caldora sp. SIO3E6]
MKPSPTEESNVKRLNPNGLLQTHSSKPLQRVALLSKQQGAAAKATGGGDKDFSEVTAISTT